MPVLASEHVPLPTTDLLTWMFDLPTYDKDKPIFIDAANTSRAITCRQARAMVRRIAAGLKNAGFQRGDCLCMHTFNDIHYPVACLGAVAAGGVFAGTNPAYTVAELEHSFRTAEVRFLIVGPHLLPNVRAAASKVGIPESNIFAFDVDGEDIPPGIRSWTTLQDHGEIDWERYDDIETGKRTSVSRLFSSGTTGLPKAMDMSSYNCTSQHTLVMEHRPRPYEVRRIICNPMFLVAQVARCHISALRGGYSMYIMRRFEMGPWLANIEKFRITELNVVPAMVVMLLNSPLLKKSSLESVNLVFSGSAPLDKDLQARFKKYLRDDAVVNVVWGMSETCCVGMYYYYPDEDSSGAVGRPLPNHDVKLVDEEGKDITLSGNLGELCMRGPSIFKGYCGIPTEFDEDGYYHTGDLSHYNKDTNLWYINGRKKELIKVRGFQVAPQEIEAVLLNHPDVADASVIGVQESAETSEFPRAYIIPKPGSNPSVAAIKAYTAERLAKYKQLEGGVVFVDSLPKNANSKVMKNVLRDRAKKEMSARL
ncbi:AMP-binding enzyme [Rhizodiscina lignyota]|uniref:AMP-binding enzyme n=1 Tax=Rhizodiscina lignyota TaxID=1504668 RepID=A0A9P4MB68_9PEZI|nr:AMP-binding enzyme [Rhizodiscina lignyota]